MGTVIESIHSSEQDLHARTTLLERQLAEIKPRVPDNRMIDTLFSGTRGLISAS